MDKRKIEIIKFDGNHYFLKFPFLDFTIKINKPVFMDLVDSGNYEIINKYKN